MNGHQIARTIQLTCSALVNRFPGSRMGDPGRSILLAFEALAKSFEETQSEIDAREDPPRSSGAKT